MEKRRERFLREETGERENEFAKPRTSSRRIDSDQEEDDLIVHDDRPVKGGNVRRSVKELESIDDITEFKQTNEEIRESSKEKVRRKMKERTISLSDDARHRQSTNNSGTSGLQVQEEQVEEFERKKHLKEMWKNRVSKIIQQVKTKGGGGVTSEVSYDFFSRVWDNEDNEEFEEDPLPDERDTTADVESLAEAIQLLRSEYFNEDERQPWEQACMWAKSAYRPWGWRLSEEDKLLFVPSSRPVSLGLRLDAIQQTEARNLEEEGFYVGIKPYLPPWNLNKIQNRLIRHKEAGRYLGEDGGIKALACPLRQETMKLVQYETQKEDLVERLSGARMMVDRVPPPSSEEQYAQLNLDVSHLVFDYHPLCTHEHVLAHHLRRLHQKYSHLQKEDTLNAINLRLKASREALSHLEDDGRQTHSKTLRKRAQIYTTEIKKLMENKELVEQEKRSLLKNILSTWLELKNSRLKQGFTSTSVNLNVTKDESVDEEVDWQEELEQQVQLERNKFQEMYEEELEEYRRKKRLWKRSRKSRGQKRKPSNDEEDDDGMDEEEEPIRPRNSFDELKVREEVRERLASNKRKSNQGNIKLELDESTTITPDQECPSPEKKRRREMSKVLVAFQIHFNGKQVCQSTFESLKEDFSVWWRNIFGIRIYNEARNLQIKLLEMSGSSSSSPKLLANIYLPIPEEHVTSDNRESLEMDFTSQTIVKPKFNALGSGVRVNSQVVGGQWLLTNGRFNCGVAWAVDTDGSVLCPKPKRTGGILEDMKGSDVKRDSSRGDEDLSKLLDEGQIDPNDPSNADFLENLQKGVALESLLEGNSVEKNSDYFRLDPMMDAWDFVTEEELEGNARFNLLQLRAQESGDFHNYQMVPAHEKDIPKDVLDAIWKTSADDEFSTLSQRDRTWHLVNKVREQVTRSYLSSQHVRTLEDIVVEEQVPSIGTLGFNLLQLTKRRRPLRPIRKERKKMTGQGISSTRVKIVVNVMRAMNVPVRCDPDALKSAGRMPIVPFAEIGYESQARPFIEIMFQRQTTRTRVADGPQPTWNEELHLSFKAPNDDYSPSNLEKVKDVIYLNLFDEVVVDLIEDDRERENTIHQKLERRWLGTLKIPFSTLYLNTKIEGTFQVETPSVLLGYEQEAKPWIVSRPETDTMPRATYLSLYFTLEPSLQLPELKDKTFKCENAFLRAAEEWQRQMSSKYSQRPVKSIALDLAGNWTFITRYLRPLAPPEELSQPGRDPTEIAELLARFVSLIPSSPDSVHASIKCDIWLTCDQFLQILTGDEEEHAVLLCNFFLHLKKRAFLLLGSGIPEGETAYVMTFEDRGEIWCWNAATGIHFDVRDSFCPLQRIGCVLSPNNIWKNIQKHDHPSRMNFNLNKSKDWQPFFHKKNPHPGFASVQPETLLYKATSLSYVEELEEQLESVLRESIMLWRKRFRTTWNRYCNQILRKVLPKLEMNVGRTASLDSLEQLEPILKSHKMSGFPLNMSFTDIQAVTEAVFATGVHLAEGKDLEFALAVYLHPYPCSVLAVWLYVATLEKR